MVRPNISLCIALLVLGGTALPQGIPDAITPSNDTGILPQSIIDNLPLIPVSGDDSSTVVQASNSSLVEHQPEIVANVSSSLDLLSDATTNLTRRAECPSGVFGFPTTAWTNVLLIGNRVCDYWFPNNQVSWVPVPLPPPGSIEIAVPLGPGLPTLRYKYKTQSFFPTDIFTPVTSTICKARYMDVLNYVTTSLSCPSTTQVHDGDNFDEKIHAAQFGFVVTL